MSDTDFSLDNFQLSQIHGPTPYSHWVIPNRLLASACPGDPDPNLHERVIRDLVDTGIQVVVNTMENSELVNIRPYEHLLMNYARQVNREIELISFPIPDRSVHKDNQHVLNFCFDLCTRLRKGQIILVHCKGGHGRTGTIISIMIGILFSMNSEQALAMNRHLHSQRQIVPRYSSPEVGIQCEQVRVILDEIYRNNQKTKH